MSTNNEYTNITMPSFSAAGTGAADDTTAYLARNTTTGEAPVDLGGANWAIFQIANAAPTGSPTTPTLDTVIQTSIDGTNWYTLLTITQVTTAATVSVMAASRHMLVATAQPFKMGRFYRFTSSVGTVSGTATYAIVVTILAGN